MITKKELAQKWGVCTKTIERYTQYKGLPYIQSEFNKRVYFDEKEVELWREKVGMLVGKQD